jgi:branched-subunit amino acid transport protein
VSTQLVGLALLMALVTYPWRLAPLLAPGMERLPLVVQSYLRLVGPAVLAALAAASIAIGVDADGGRSFQAGVAWLSVAACILIVAWRRNLFAGLLVATLLAATVRAAT